MTQAEVTEQDKIQVYTADECGPCQEVKAAVEAGNFEILGLAGQIGVETIDVAEGDNYLLLEDLSIEAIPAAYHQAQVCKIFIDEETKKVTFDCRPEGAQAHDEQKANS